MKHVTLLYFSDSNKFGVYNFLFNLKKTINNSNYKISLYSKNNLLGSIKYIKSSHILYLNGCWNFNYFLIFILAKLKKKKIFFSPHGMLDSGSLNYKKFKKKIAWIFYQKIILNYSNMIIVNSKLEKKNLNLLGVHNNISIIPHGITTFNLKSPKYKSNSSIFRVIFFSRIHPIKGLAELVNFWIKSRFLLNSSQYQLDVYGYAEDKDYLKSVRFIIYKNKVNNINIFSNNKFYNKKIISNYDLLIAPSISENFSLVVLEALYLKVPVVTSVNMPWKFLEKLDLGLTINFLNYRETKKIFLFIKKLKKKKYKKKFIINSAKLIREKYNWSLISKKYISIFEKFI